MWLAPPACGTTSPGLGCEGWLAAETMEMAGGFVKCILLPTQELDSRADCAGQSNRPLAFVLKRRTMMVLDEPRRT
jgi:hypothetical protein